MTPETHSKSLRQVHFPRRTRLSVPSAKSNLRPRSVRPIDQSTLTQLHFVTPETSFEDREESGPEYGEVRLKKRRRMESSKDEEEEELRQATLTQIGWLSGSDGEEDDEGSEIDEEDHAPLKDMDSSRPTLVARVSQGLSIKPGAEICRTRKVQLQHEPDDDRAGDFESEEEVEKETDCPFVHALSAPSTHTSRDNAHSRKQSDEASSPTPSASSSNANCRHIPQSPSPELGASFRATPSAIGPHLKTPQKRSNRTIPSSQSPASTPLTFSSRSPTKRTPLSELHENIWAQRDESPTPARRKAVQDSETSDDDKENLDLALAINEKKTRQKHISDSPASSPVKTPSRTRHSDAESMPPLPLSLTRLRGSALSMHDHLSTTQQSFSAPLHVSSMRSSVSPKKSSSTSTDHSAETNPPIRSSQATTVDLTQSPRSQRTRPTGMQFAPALDPDAALVDNSPSSKGANDMLLDLPPSPPPLFESQFPYSMFSCDGDEGGAGGWYGRYGEEGDSQERGGDIEGDVEGEAHVEII